MTVNGGPRPAHAAIGVGVAGIVFLAATSHGPASREIAGALLRAGFWTLVVAAAARVGAALTRSRLRGLPHLLWDGAAGLPALVALWLVVGFLPGGFGRVPILLVLGGFVALAIVLARRDAVSRLHDPDAEPTGLPGLLAAALVTAIAAVGLAWDRVPPVFFDTLAYHFALPELWLVEGRIAPVSWSLHSWFPPGMSVLYGVGLALQGERLAADANVLVGVLLLGLAWDFGRRRAGPGGGLGAIAALLSLPITIHALGIPAADLGHGLFAAGSLGALLVGRGDEGASWRRRAAWLAAGAVGTKWLGMLVPVALGALWLVLGRDAGERAEPIVARLRRGAEFVLPAILLLAPWCLADAIATGNPVAPVGAWVLPTAGLAEGGAAVFRGDARGGLPSVADLRSLAPRLLGVAGEEGSFYPAPAWGFLPLVLLVAIPLARRGERSLDLLALAAVVFALWFLTYRWERFLVASSFLLAVALGAVLASAWRRGGVHRLPALLAVLLGAAGAVGAVDRVVAFTGGGTVAVGREAPDAFFERAFAYSGVVRRASPPLDPGTTRILFVGEMRHYGLDVPRVAPTGFNVHPLVEVLAASEDPTSARESLSRRGFTHLLVDPGWVERSGRSYPSLAPIVAEPARFAALLRALGEPVARERGAALYRIAP